jgi:hypothetical protein
MFKKPYNKQNIIYIINNIINKKNILLNMQDYLDEDTVDKLSMDVEHLTNDDLKALKKILESIAEEELIQEGLIKPIYRNGEIIDSLLTKRGIIEYCKMKIIAKSAKAYFSKKNQNQDDSEIETKQNEMLDKLAKQMNNLKM